MNNNIKELIDNIENNYNEFKKKFKNFSKKDIDYFIKKKNSDTGDYLRKIQENVLTEKQNENIVENLLKPVDKNYTTYFQAVDKCIHSLNIFKTLKKNLQSGKTFDGKKNLSTKSTINNEQFINKIIYYLDGFILTLHRIQKMNPYDDN